MKRTRQAAIEPLESRRLMSAGTPHVYAPDQNVRGESINQYVADWWTKVFQTPVHDAGGTVTNPMAAGGDTTAQGDGGKVFFLYGNLLGGAAHTATVPTGTPVFIPVLPIEFSNFDTTTGNTGMTLPGGNTAAQLSDFAAQAATPALTPPGTLHLTVDGQSLPNVAAFREIAPTFSYVLPPTDNLDQFFFGNPDLHGLVSPAEADGFYVMLKPLAPGTHTLDFGGTTPGGPLGALNVEITYTIDVVPVGQFDKSPLAAVNAAAQASSPFSDSPVDGAKRHRLFDDLD